MFFDTGILKFENGYKNGLIPELPDSQGSKKNIDKILLNAREFLDEL